MKMIATFGRVVDPHHRDRQRAERGRGQIAKELDERLGEPRHRRQGAAQDAERHADQRRDQEAPEDDADAVQQRLVQPGLVGARGRRGEAGHQRAQHFVRRRQEHRVRRPHRRARWPPRAATRLFSVRKRVALDHLVGVIQSTSPGIRHP